MPTLAAPPKAESPSKGRVTPVPGHVDQQPVPAQTQPGPADVEYDYIPEDSEIHVGSADLRMPHVETPEAAQPLSFIWSYAIPIIVFHLLAPLAFTKYFFSWTGVALVPIDHVHRRRRADPLQPVHNVPSSRGAGPLRSRDLR